MIVLGVDPSTDGGMVALWQDGSFTSVHSSHYTPEMYAGVALAVVEVPNSAHGVYVKGAGISRKQAGDMMRSAASAATLREQMRAYCDVLEVSANDARAWVCGYAPRSCGKADPYIKTWLQQQGYACKLRGSLGNTHRRDAAIAALVGVLYLQAGERAAALFGKAKLYPRGN